MLYFILMTENMENEFKSFLKTVGSGEGDRCYYPTRLDVYGKGCEHNCVYCYSRSLLAFRGLWNAQNPAAADMTKVKKAIDKLAKSGFTGAVRMGGMTDCFQPKAEKKYRNTYETIKYLNEKRIHYLIVTKSSLVVDPEYIRIYDKELAHIQISITSTDNDTALKYEKASRISERIWALEELHRKGFDVALRLSPFIPEFYDYDVLNQIKCEKVIVEFLRINTWVKRWFDIDFSPYTLKSGGYLHLPLETKLKALEGLKFSQISVCEDVPEHYEYFRDNVNVNKEDCCNLSLSYILQ